MKTTTHFITMAWLSLVALAASPLHAHEGEDHGAPSPVTTQPLAPRVEANSGEVQLLGILQGDKLIVYLDRYASNEPIVNAKLEAESGTFKAAAQARGDGTYALPAAALAQPGKHALVFSVEAGELSDLLNGTLNVPTPAANDPVPAAAQWPVGALAAGGAVLVLIAGGLLLHRHRLKGQQQ